MKNEKETDSKFKLTAASYYSPDRPHISASMIKDYLKSPKWYYRCHVEKSVEREPTPSLKIGSIVDAHLTGEKNRYQVSCLKRDNAALYEMQKAHPELCVTQSEMNRAVAMYEAVERCDFWKNPMGKREMQVILESHFGDTPTCGKPDIIEWDADGNVWIIDLKTAQPANVKTIFAWERTCYEYGYFLQLMMYAWLFLANHPEMNFSQLRFGFITVTCDRDLVAKVQLFKVDWRLVDAQKPVIEETLNKILLELFEDPMPTWDQAMVIGGKESDMASMDDWNADEEEETV